MDSAPNLVFQPPELVFREKFGYVEGVTLLIKNENAREIYFKVKSTVPDLYYVRPTSGIIKPHSQMEVLVQPRDGIAMSLDANEAAKHSFMIQSAYVDHSSTSMPPEQFLNENAKDSSKVAKIKFHAKVYRIQPETMDDKIVPNVVVVAGESKPIDAEMFASGGENSTTIGGSQDVCNNIMEKALAMEKDSAIPELNEVTKGMGQMDIGTAANVSIDEKENKSPEETEKIDDVPDEESEQSNDRENLGTAVDENEKNEEQEIESSHNESVANDEKNVPIIPSHPCVHHHPMGSNVNLSVTSPHSSFALVSPAPAANLFNTSFFGLSNQQAPARASNNGGINDSYGRYVGKVLDNLPAKRASALKKEMNELIAEFEKQED